MFAYLRNPYPHVAGGLHDFYGRLHAGAQGGSLCPKALGSNKQGEIHSPTLFRLTVELLLWLEAQNIIVRARHIPGCLNVIADHLSRPIRPISTEWSLHPEIVKRIFRLWGTPEVDMFCDSVELPPSSVHVSSSGTTNPSGGCSVSGLAWEVNVHVSSIQSAQQSHSEAPVHPGAEVFLVAPWWPKQSWFPHLLRLCVDHPLCFPYRRDLLSQQDSMSRTESHTICTHGGSHVTL